MYISQLELQGFKSFANKTKINFHDGVTAIVGPNGCGKSNIVDSLRWVLGEQRPTLLRSSSMSNVIFNGTAQKKALGMAEVSLTFVNNRGVLPTEYNEVTICRRLFRSGDSEYLINDTTCRLKDIMELFMDTGMGSDAYSVIELKMVDEILQDKNNDRRRLFEEAAGVTKYKDKRKKTFRKLDETETDLQRLDDILVEIRKNVRSLQKQAEKARKANEYQNELKKLDLAVNKTEYTKLKKELKPLAERIDATEKEKRACEQQLLTKEEEEQKARKHLTEQERKLADVNRKLGKLKSDIQEKQNRKNVLAERINNSESVQKQQQKEIKNTREDLEELRNLLDSNKDLLESAQKSLTEAQKNLNTSREQYNALQKEQAEYKQIIQAKGEEIKSVEQQLTTYRNEKIRIDSKLETLREEYTRIQNEIQKRKQKLEGLADEKQQAENLALQKKEQLEIVQHQLTEAETAIEELNERENNTKDQLRQLKSNRDALEAEIDLLEDIAQSNEMFSETVRFLLEQKKYEWPTLEVISNIFSIKASMAVALESALGPASQFLVTDSMQTVRQAKSILKEQKKGKATFIPLDQIQSQYETLPDSIAHEVTVPPKYESLKNLLLGHIVLADNMEHATSLRSENSDITVVTPEGDVITSDGFLTTGSQGKNVGLKTGLNDKIQVLSAQIDELEKQQRSVENTLINIQQQRKHADIKRRIQAVKQAEKELQAAEKAVASTENKRSLYASGQYEQQARLEQIEQQIETLEEKRTSFDPKSNHLHKQLDQLQHDKNKLEEKLADSDEKRLVAQNRYNDARLKHQDVSHNVTSYKRDIERAEKGINQLEKRIEQRKKSMQEYRKQIEANKITIEELKEEIARLLQKRSEVTAEQQQLEKICRAYRGQINQIEKTLKDVRKQKDTHVDLLHSLNLAHNELELKAKTISDHIWEQYEILMNQINASLPAGLNLETGKQRLQKLKQKLQGLGTTNPLSIKEYEEEKERLDFYENQIEDLTQAREKLLATIAEINETANERFDKVFSKIRTNFKKVFQTLFQKDDYCDLIIEEEAEDPLEAKIEIKANPKGKRPSSINQLSGGEKTLTAIALLFAIYLVKPSPFCVLDEVDAPLDDANIERFANMLNKFSDFTQFIIITHNKKTMAKAKMVYGVTMPETGVSRLVGVKLEDVEDFDLE